MQQARGGPRGLAREAQAGLADAAGRGRTVEVGEPPSRNGQRVEIENLMKAAADAEERHRKGIEAVRDEWQGRLRGWSGDATADADRAASSRRPIASAARSSRAQLRRSPRLRSELQRPRRIPRRACAPSLNRRWRTRRDRPRAGTCRALLVEEREQAERGRAVVDARATERQAQLAVVERLLHAVRDRCGAIAQRHADRLDGSSRMVAPARRSSSSTMPRTGQDLQPMESVGFWRRCPAPPSGGGRFSSRRSRCRRHDRSCCVNGGWARTGIRQAAGRSCRTRSADNSWRLLRRSPLCRRWGGGGI